MFGLQHHLVVLCKEAPLWPLTYTSGERYSALLFNKLLTYVKANWSKFMSYYGTKCKNYY